MGPEEAPVPSGGKKIPTKIHTLFDVYIAKTEGLSLQQKQLILTAMKTVIKEDRKLSSIASRINKQKEAIEYIRKDALFAQNSTLDQYRPKDAFTNMANNLNTMSKADLNNYYIREITTHLKEFFTVNKLSKITEDGLADAHSKLSGKSPESRLDLEGYLVLTRERQVRTREIANAYVNAIREMMQWPVVRRYAENSEEGIIKDAMAMYRITVTRLNNEKKNKGKSTQLGPKKSAKIARKTEKTKLDAISEILKAAEDLYVDQEMQLNTVEVRLDCIRMKYINQRTFLHIAMEKNKLEIEKVEALDPLGKNMEYKSELYLELLLLQELSVTLRELEQVMIMSEHLQKELRNFQLKILEEEKFWIQATLQGRKVVLRSSQPPVPQKDAFVEVPIQRKYYAPMHKTVEVIVGAFADQMRETILHPGKEKVCEFAGCSIILNPQCDYHFENDENVEIRTLPPPPPRALETKSVACETVVVPSNTRRILPQRPVPPLPEMSAEEAELRFGITREKYDTFNSATRQFLLYSGPVFTPPPPCTSCKGENHPKLRPHQIRRLVLKK